MSIFHPHPHIPGPRKPHTNRMTSHGTKPMAHKPPTPQHEDHFLRQAQLNDARRELDAGTPFNPRKKIPGVIGTGKHAATHSNARHNTGPYSGRHRSGY